MWLMMRSDIYRSAGGLFLTQINADVLLSSVSSLVDDPAVALLRGRAAGRLRRSSLVERRQRAVHVISVLLKTLKRLQHAA